MVVLQEYIKYLCSYNMWPNSPVLCTIPKGGDHAFLGRPESSAALHGKYHSSDSDEPSAHRVHLLAASVQVEHLDVYRALGGLFLSNAWLPAVAVDR